MIDPKKYDKPVPRYTSYPTVPAWNVENFSTVGYEKSLQTAYWESNKEVSIYIHLPFCESLCTYCACNTRITKNHAVEEPYIDNLLKEWQMYLDRLPDAPVVREIHLGGGTPTFFNERNLQRLLEGIFKKVSIADNASMSFEGHPANTTPKHLRKLHSLGFDRLSLGIQDFDLNVQKLINRMQTFEQVKAITEKAREIGYTSINYDMVYGLPGQSLKTLDASLRQVADLNPDRIAYYSYAHVPSMRPAQKHYEEHLPTADLKREFMLTGREEFIKQGYLEVGMDHFVRPEDELMKAQKGGYLHRNFMGYTPFSSRLLVGLGMSAISDSWTGFAQNEKTLEAYNKAIAQGRLPIIKGHLHTEQDIFLRSRILDLMCKFRTNWGEDQIKKFEHLINFDLINELELDGLVVLKENGLIVTDAGRQFIRIICSAFDVSLGQKNAFQFSRA